MSRQITLEAHVQRYWTPRLPAHRITIHDTGLTLVAPGKVMASNAVTVWDTQAHGYLTCGTTQAVLLQVPTEHALAILDRSLERITGLRSMRTIHRAITQTLT